MKTCSYDSNNNDEKKTLLAADIFKERVEKGQN
jgi:hypothetical protein